MRKLGLVKLLIGKGIMKLKALVKKTFIYDIYKRIRYGKPEEVTQIIVPQVQNKEFRYDCMLGQNEYRFLTYKKKRNRYYRINVNKIRIPYKTDLVSIVLPVFNGEDYVRGSIESVLAQTYTNFELIIVDDGSFDQTPVIVDEFASLDERVKVIHQENCKLPKTLSRGFREARGEFFTWTSADNIMHPEFIEKFVREMKKYNHTSMIFGNIKLIDETGKEKTDFGWYASDINHPENVIFPKSVLELNTYANNYIGAAFMYRAVAANVVEDYSAYKYGIEDYDYWMKINELFTLRHVSFDEPEYSYRMHSKSLTSKDKELKITENRYRQMLLDDFRRDYYLKKVCWIIETDDVNKKAYQDLMKMIEKAKQTVIGVEQANQQTSNLFERFVYISYAKTDILDECIPDNAFKVLITDTPIALEDENKWDAYICNGEVTDHDFIKGYKGWFGIDNGEDIFAFVDSKARNRFLYELEADEVMNRTYDKQFSVIVSFSSNYNRLRKCIDSVTSREDVEVIVVAESEKINNLNVDELGVDKLIVSISGNDVTRKNMAAREAKGKYLIFLQDDCCMEKNCLSKLSDIFQNNEKIAAIFGSVSVQIEKENNVDLKYLGEYTIRKDEIYCYSDSNIPSGYAFATRNNCFKMVGGFYHLSEECPQQFCQEIMIGMAMALEKFGYYIFQTIDFEVKRFPEMLNTQDISDVIQVALFGNYYLKMNTILPYNVWPETLVNEISDLENQLTISPDNEWKRAECDVKKRLLVEVRNNFREKEKVELNRDLFSRLS